MPVTSNPKIITSVTLNITPADTSLSPASQTYKDTTTLSSLQTGNNSLQIDKTEILYYSASLSDADVAQNVAYLSNKWFKYT